jgi:small conductance mechanosensitive channel
MNDLKRTLIDFIVRYGFQVMGAIIIIAAGVVASSWMAKVLRGWLNKRELEPPVRSLVVNLAQLVVIAFTVVIALGAVGVPIAPLVAGISVVGVGVSLAMQGVLGNLVAGLLIIFTKPFRVGEYIDLLGVYGQVTDIKLFSTTLVHTDRSRVVIPNRKISGEILHNYGAIRQLDLSVGVSYNTDLKNAMAVAHEVLNRNAQVLKDPPAIVGISQLGDSAITLAIKPWVAVDDFVSAQAALYQTMVEQFKARQIEIPFPQREIRLLGEVPANKMPH